MMQRGEETMGNDLPGCLSSLRIGEALGEDGAKSLEGVKVPEPAGTDAKDEYRATGASGAVCGAGQTGPDAPGVQRQAESEVPAAVQCPTPPATNPAPLATRLGFAHPWKPRTPTQIAEFAVLWSDLDLTVEQIAGRFKVSKRTIQTWRKEFGLPPRNQVLDMTRQGLTVGNVAVATMRDLSATARVAEQIEMASAGQADGSLGPVGARSGSLVDPDTIKQFDPLKDAEVMALLETIRQETRKITSHSDLMALNRRLTQLSVLCVAKMPLATWESLHLLLESLSRGLLRLRKVEAELPPPDVDQRLLRQEAGRQMMQELREVLDPNEQEILAKLVKTGADRIMAKRNSINMS